MFAPFSRAAKRVIIAITVFSRVDFVFVLKTKKCLTSLKSSLSSFACARKKGNNSSFSQLSHIPVHARRAIIFNPSSFFVGNTGFHSLALFFSKKKHCRLLFLSPIVLFFAPSYLHPPFVFTHMHLSANI